MSASRDPWLDNAKMLLVTSVVVGHVLAVLTVPDPFRDHLYDALYVVHMPAFLLVTGYLSRRAGWTRRHLGSLLTTMVVPYVVFSLLLWGLRRAHTGEGTEERLLLEPFWAMWFLAALVVWRLATPLLRAHPLVVPASVVVALTAPAWSLDVLALERVLQFLPFFVVGLHARREWLERLHQPLARVLAVLALLGVWAATAHLDRWAGTEWLFNDHAYAELGVDFSAGVATRAMLLALSFAGALAVLALVPTGQRWFTALGARSMTVYLAHTLVVQAVQYDELLADLDAGPALLAGVVLGTAVAIGLATPPAVRALRWFVDPVGSARELRARPRVLPAVPAGEGLSPADATPGAPRSAAAGRAPAPARG
ncbi:acyltransferase family protein [Nocardioides sp. ChNu-153]|uniref:acyltransferase family protein n=1 Tax=unclassified Nocardioides TaxID=2615069 RepID=UPI00240614F1|nr:MULTISPECIES: acyltransferase family protein [unclassified Nocardioides]MDF9714535.1 acyltransferase family protein [Nocardioides sp. ChNu-99]MDN7119932.1 acyltransferase family protein [Nocardioides sp. ChNu-153]